MSTTTTTDVAAILNNVHKAYKKDPVEVLRDTLYPGAALESVQMVIGYCTGKRVDPFMKYVYIVPMWTNTKKKDKSGKDIWGWQDQIMPGIGLYRLLADRTGRYAGISAPTWGQLITKKLGNAQVTYPEWCRMTIKKIVQGRICKSEKEEWWEENYSSKAKDDPTPNKTWMKRQRGMLSKCTESQGLRSNFPEDVPHEYTYEEMQGKTFEATEDSDIVLPKQREIIKIERNVVPVIHDTVLGDEPYNYSDITMNTPRKSSLKTQENLSSYTLMPKAKVEILPKDNDLEETSKDEILGNLYCLMAELDISTSESQEWATRGGCIKLQDLDEEKLGKLVVMLNNRKAKLGIKGEFDDAI